MMAAYPYVLTVHICAIILSGSLFFARGLASLLGSRWPRLRPVRMLTYSIDTVLLAAALTLVFILPKGVFANQWLTVKLLLVFAYVASGLIAMRASVRKSIRSLAFILGLLTFANIVGVAINHSPFGWLSIAA